MPAKVFPGSLRERGFQNPISHMFFLTHLHDDHTAGLPSLMSFAYTTRTQPMTIHGPPQTFRLVESALAYLSVSAEIRAAESPGRFAPLERVFEAREIDEGVLFDDGFVEVSAVENTHFNLEGGSPAARHRSYSYRFRTPFKTIVFTGDTGPSSEVERFAKDADILVAEIVPVKDIASVPAFRLEHMLEEHLTAAELGKLASRANVRTVVLSHFREIEPEDANEVRQYFDGEVVIGSDIDRF
jgi:ribonuclease BN (tRNA processing enzyme)